MTIFSTRLGVFGCVYCLKLILLYAMICVSARSDKEIRERFYGNLVNSSSTGTGEGSIAKMFDQVLDKEFSENDQPEGSDASSFNTSVADQQAVLETVAKITHEKGKRNDTQEAKIQDVFSLENEDSDETTTLIDKKMGHMIMYL